MHRLGSNERPDWRLAVVIGAGALGMAAARRLSQRHRVLVADIDQDRAEAAAESLRHEGGDAAGFGCDVTAPAAVEALAERVADLGGLGVLAHVAALSPSMADFAAIMRVNLTGVALVAESLLAQAQAGSAAILISSLGGHNLRLPDSVETLLRAPTDPALVEKLAAELGEAATPSYAYSLAKHGLMAYCRGQAAAWGARGARIVSLSPGIIARRWGRWSSRRTRASCSSTGARRCGARERCWRSPTPWSSWLPTRPRSSPVPTFWSTAASAGRWRKAAGPAEPPMVDRRRGRAAAALSMSPEA
jgi:NAD(P)-dependent dehydrogenase (short-subunit alcohol dehydrogenase family)